MRLSIYILLAWFGSALSLSAQSTDLFLIVRNTGEKILSDQNSIRVFGFAETLGQQPGVPGPTLVMSEGDSVILDVWNVSQGAPHTVHLHGLDVDQANDGVPHLSFTIPHMEHGFYNFVAPHSGTYLYHCHVASTIHVQAGMYGLLVVNPPDGTQTTWDGGYAYDHTLSLLMSEIDTFWHHDSILDHAHDTSQMITYLTLPEFHPQFFLVNGLSDQQITDDSLELKTKREAVNYVRLANIGYYINRVIFPAALDASIIDSDGRPLPAQQNTDTVELYPGERYGVLFQPTADLSDQISIQYINMNTGTIANTQYVPLTVEGYIGIESVSADFEQMQISPNPFISETTVSIKLNKAGPVNLSLIDISGKLISELHNSDLNAGTHEFTIDTNLPAGIYIVRLAAGDDVLLSKKIVKH